MELKKERGDDFCQNENEDRECDFYPRLDSPAGICREGFWQDEKKCRARARVREILRLRLACRRDELFSFP